MVEQAVHFSTLAPNIQVKFPCTAAGLAGRRGRDRARRRRQHHRRASRVAQAIAAAEAVERGLAALRGGRRRHQPVQPGLLADDRPARRLDEGPRRAGRHRPRPGRRQLGRASPPSSGPTASSRSAATGRGCWPRRTATGSTGPSSSAATSCSRCPTPGRSGSTAPASTRSARIDVPVDPALIDDLLARIPDFVRAYEPDGMVPDGVRSLRRHRPDPARLRSVVPRSAGRRPRHHPAQPGRQARPDRQPSRHPTRTARRHRTWPSRLPTRRRSCRSCRHWINGTAVEVLPENTGPITNPATGQVFARVPRGGQAEVDQAVAAAKAAFPAWRDMPLIARSNIFFAFRNLMYEHREELAALITRDHGKTFPDALAEVLRGIETIDFACGLPVHLSGLMTPNVSTKVDAFTLRAPLGVMAAITPFNFPVMVPTWIYPIALMCRQHGHPQAVLPHPGRHPAPGRAVDAGRRPRRHVQRRLRRQGGRQGDRRAHGHQGDPVRRLHGRRPVRLRGGDQARQARRVLHQRQERDARPAGRGHGPRRRRGGRRGLRLGRRALHGPDPDGRGRRHRRAPHAQDPRPDREAQDRQRHGAGHRHGPDLHRRAPRVGHQVDRHRRGRGRGAARRRPHLRGPEPRRVLPGRHAVRQRHART